MQDIKFPKAKKFLEAHPNMTVSEAIRYLDGAIKKTKPDTN